MIVHYAFSENTECSEAHSVGFGAAFSVGSVASFVDPLCSAAPSLGLGDFATASGSTAVGWASAASSSANSSGKY
jgi:hypothetical protein